MEHAHGLLCTLDRIIVPDPEVRAKARAEVSRRITADVVEVMRQYIAADLPNPFAMAAEVLDIQNHAHSYSCFRNGQCRHGYPQPALSWAEFPGHKIASGPAKEACSPREYRQEGT